MPDTDGTIRVGTSVDTSGLKAGKDQAAAINAELVANLKAQYASATAAVKQATANMAEATAYMGTAAANGVQEAIVALKQYELELSEAQAAQAQAAASVNIAVAAIQSESAELNENAAALGKDTAASLADSEATDKLAYSKLRAGLAARALTQEVGGPLSFVVGRLAAESSAIGPIFEKMFVPVAAVAGGLILADIVEKIIEWKEGIQDLIKENETVGKQLEEERLATIKLVAEAHKLQLERTGVEHGRAAEAAARETDANKLAVQDAREIAALQTKLRLQQAITAAGRATPTVTEKVGAGGAVVSVPNQGAGASQEKIKAAYQEITLLASELTEARARLAKDSAELALQQSKNAKDTASEIEAAARKAAAAERQRVAEMRKSDEDALSDLKADHRLTLNETQSFWESRLAAEHGYTDRLREINHALGAIYQEQDKLSEEHFAKVYEQQISAGRENAVDTGGHQAELNYLQQQAVKLQADVEAGALGAKEALERVMQDIPRVVKEANSEAEEAVRKTVNDQFTVWEQGGHRTLAEIKNYWTQVAIFFTGVDDQIVQEADRHLAQVDEKIRETAAKLADLKLKASEETQIGGLEQQRAQLQQNQTLNPAITNQGRVQELEQMRAIDQQEAQIRIDTERQTLAETEALYTQYSTQYQQEQNKLVQIQQQAGRKEIQDTTAILAQMQAPYKAFFNEINQDFTKAFDAMLTKQKNWQQQFQKMWNDIVLQFTNRLIQMALKWAENQVLMTTVHKAAKVEQAADDDTAAAETQAVTAKTTLQTIQGNAAGAASGAYNATVGIPIVGPVLAPAAAATAYAAVLAFGALAAFEQGGIIPNTGVALVHQGEGVLNRQLTNNVMNMTSGANQSSTAQYNLNYSPQYHGSDAPASSPGDAAGMLRMVRQATLGLHTA